MATLKDRILSSNTAGQKGNYQRFPDLVADLVKLKVDLILTAGTPGALAAKRATQTIPIVMAVTG